MTDINQNLKNLMQEAQKMQERMQKAQDELTRLVVVGRAGGGLVEIHMNGRHDVTKVTISPNLENEDRNMLADLIAAAVNDAVRQVEKASKEKIATLTASLNIPTDFMPGSDGASGDAK
jgi:nucleoid-associated protein EbfC